jgi:hypothetical protein
MKTYTTTHSSGKTATRKSEHDYAYAGWITTSDGRIECKVFSATYEGAAKGAARWITWPAKFNKSRKPEIAPGSSYEVQPVKF